MAQYFTDFSEYTKNVQPPDWTKRWTSFSTVEVRTSRFSGATGGAVLYTADGGNASKLLSWDAIDSDAGRADCEIVMRFRGTGTSSHFGAVCRASGSAGSETGYRNGATTAVSAHLTKFVNGSFTTLASEGSGLSGGAWHWVRSRVEGTALKVRVWTEPDPEPGTWTLETTDTSISAAGWVGVFNFTTEPVDFDVFGVGTNGDSAPMAPPDPGGTEGALLGPNGRLLRGPSGGLLRLAP